MSQLGSIVDGLDLACKSEASEQDAWKTAPPESAGIERTIHEHVKDILEFLRKPDPTRSLDAIERGLVSLVFALGRLFLAFFLAWREEHSKAELRCWAKRGFRRRRLQSKHLGTFFGKVRYWRTYMTDESSSGLYPLDLALGISRDGFSLLVLDLAARLATVVSFDQVTVLMRLFLGWSPSKTSVEKMVLGLGKHTGEWFREAPPPADDGEVLIIQVDSKATPTATEAELQKRRGKRRPNPFPESPRHRGRDARRRRGPKPRRKKGDKSKNGKAAHLVVMYTLKRGLAPDGKPALLGPRNRKVYASYTSKRHAFEVARREANKRGFPNGSGKLVQLITDGDEDLERLGKEFFPEAIHTLDVMHAMEYLWEAGGCLFKEGSRELATWVKKLEKLLYRGKVFQVLGALAAKLDAIPKTGPGNKGRRERLEKALGYLYKRTEMMNYAWLKAQDLELSSGSVEGAVKHVIAKRFDSGSMRWIRERAEALLQLRAIEINGDWRAFIRSVHQKTTARARREAQAPVLLSLTAAPLPESAKSA